MILVLAILLGCANAVDMPVRQSFAIELVGREDVGNAVALNSAMFNGSRIIGPALAGLTIAAFGVGRRVRRSTPSASWPSSSRCSMLDVTKLRTPPRIARPGSAERGHREPGRGPALRPPHAARPAGRAGRRRRRDVRHELQRPRSRPSPRTTSPAAPPATGSSWPRRASGRSSRRSHSRSAASPAASRIATGRDHPRASRPSRWRRSASYCVGRAPDGPHRLRWHLDGRHRQRHDPARGPGRPARSRDERVHDDLRELRARSAAC